jgi:hypothetical protein
MSTVDEVVAQVIARRPFAVLGYSAEDAVWCPGCLRSAAGLAPGRIDSRGRAIAPLYARDRAVREEICDNCGRPLYELLAAGSGTTAQAPVTARLRVHGKRTALDFDRVPPIEIRNALKTSSWRWDPRFRVWWSCEALPSIPPGVILPVHSPPAAQPTAPIVRRRIAKTP